MSSKPRTKSLGALMKKATAEAALAPRKLTPVEQPPLVVRSLSLTSTASDALDALIETAATRTGRKISASAVVRGLLRVVEEQDLGSEVVAQVQAELNAGEVRWGRQH